MEGWSRDRIIQIISSHMDIINKRKAEIKKVIEDLTQKNLESLDALLEQIPDSLSGPLLSKTPKASRKRNIKRIQTIPEDDMVEITQVTEDTTREQFEEKETTAPGAGRRSKREASKKAGEIMKQQQSMTLNTKLRRPSNDENDDSGLSKASSRESRSKRLRSARSSDEDQEEAARRVKQIKSEDQPPSTRSTRNKQPPVNEHASSSAEEEVVLPKAAKLSSVKRKHESSSSRQFKRPSSLQSLEPDPKKANIVDETLEADETIEQSLYEDAIGKAVPIMNSTMKPTSAANQTRTINQTPAANVTRNLNSAANETRNLNSAANETRNLNPTANETRVIKSNSKEPLERMMNVTVVLEPVRKMNETVTVSKASKERSNSGSVPNSSTISTTRKVTEATNERNHSPFSVPLLIPKIAVSKLNPVVELDALMTDDDSSPERKQSRGKKLQKLRSVAKIKDGESESEKARTGPRRITRSSLISDDEVDCTPGRKVLGDMNSERNKKEAKGGFKSNALFSPYAKESVRKRVEAFEQAVLASPTVEETEMRLTRTKTRALAAANENGEHVSNPPTNTQKLARKSLAKAKQILRAKDAKDVEECKEKLVPNDKVVQKQQQRITPNSKIRPPMPSSTSRIQATPSNSQTLSNYSKAMTGSRTNIVTNVDSFIQTKGSAQKPSSADKISEEKRKKQQEEDAKRKRDEVLKLQMEEKKRKREQKEKKNRLAREAKEKQDMENRLKAQKEKEEKAKLVQLQKDKEREEVERKRMAQQQRAQEKEERKKQEEILRQQKLYEQEEAERQLAEKQRREQEAEKRRIAAAEAKAHQAQKEKAHADALKSKAAQLKKQALAQSKQQQPNSYKIDSEPDSDSDDEMRPKHEIPVWAKPHYRQKHLAMQEYVPMQAIMRIFDVKKCTPDLSELFQGIDKNRLKRTSSAIWKTPPRFSMMEALN
ncbi:inner centromere protein A-like isoform X2 [Belonocnema kinseyi]|uniref:inner centromere protein A-like isoform X2 n=1 Tax=Belonocnema kinseyi TaxID=2817044 RepID=UPI00143E058A|nr:inner centromere protein A-like isoform X2 [Belonocnema kinseyi]